MSERTLLILFLLLPTPATPPATAQPPQYRIETLAGNDKAGDIPDGGGKATEIAVDLPFGVENGSDGALYVTTVGSDRVLRLDRRSGMVTSVAGSGRKGYAGGWRAGDWGDVE